MILRIYYIIGLLFFSSCNYFAVSADEKELARVGEKVLRESDLQAIIPDGLSDADSIQMAENFITNWIKQQLVLRKAYQNLSGDEIDVEQLVENYRNSLIRNRYEQKLVSQKLDTTVSFADIELYYQSHPDDFIANESLGRVLFVKLRSDAPKMGELKNWISENTEESRSFISEYCVQFCEINTVGDTGHVRLSQITRRIPVELQSEMRYANGQLLELKDSSYTYFILPNEIISAGEVAPLNYVQGQIKNMLLQQRKVELLKELENKLYDEALKRGQFERFDEN